MDIRKMKKEIDEMTDDNDLDDSVYRTYKNSLGKELADARKKYRDYIGLIMPYLTALEKEKNSDYQDFDMIDAVNAVNFLNTHCRERKKVFGLLRNINNLENMKLSDFMNMLGIKIYFEYSDSFINDEYIDGREYKLRGLKLVKNIQKKLDRNKRILLENWKNENDETKEAFKYLFGITEKHDFKSWLEKREETKKIRKKFEELKLDYDKWDNPEIAYGYRKGRLEKIEISVGDYAEKVKELATEVMKGSKTGVLKCSPKELWKEISADYGKIKNYKPENESCENECLNILDKIENKLKRNVSKSKNGTNGTEKKINEIRKRIKENVPMTSYYSFIFKFWERNPSVDFYEGNDSGVCTAFGGDYEDGISMAQYLVDKSVSLVDILVKGKRMGQMYFVACEEGEKPVLFMDSIEYADNGTIGKVEKKILGSVEPFLKNLSKEIGFEYSCIGYSSNHEMTPALLNMLEEKKYESSSCVIEQIGKAKSIEILSRAVPELGEEFHNFDALHANRASDFIKIK